MPLSFPSRVAIVTGSGQRVGKVIAQDLAAAGYATAIHYHRSQKAAEQTVTAIRAAGGTAEAFAADVSSEQDVQRMFSKIRACWGRVDVLVNAASIWSSQPLDEVRAEDMLNNFRVNTLGSFLCAQQAAEMMVGQTTGGVIINIGDASLDRPKQNYLPYYVSKGALPALTRSLAVELATRNPRVRVNCIHPGSVMFPEDADPQERERRVEATLVKQADDPTTMSHAVRFLIDNRFATGICMTLDGGRQLLG